MEKALDYAAHGKVQARNDTAPLSKIHRVLNNRACLLGL